MTSMKSKLSKLALFVATGIVSICVLTGCAGRMTPAKAQTATMLAVYAFGKSHPKSVDEQRVAQKLACSIVSLDGATLNDVLGEIQNIDRVSKDTKEAVSLIFAIYQTAIIPVGTNAVKTSPYLKAVFCDGWEMGLGLLPYAGSKNVPPPALVEGWTLWN